MPLKKGNYPPLWQRWEHEILIAALQSSELKQAKLAIFQRLKREQLGSIFEEVAGGKDCPEKHMLVKLYPKWDSSSRLIRFPERMDYAWDADRQPQILILSSHPVIDLLLSEIQRKLFHAGVRRTLAEIRERLWITCGRQKVKRGLYHSVI